MTILKTQHALLLLAVALHPQGGGAWAFDIHQDGRTRRMHGLTTESLDAGALGLRAWASARALAPEHREIVVVCNHRAVAHRLHLLHVSVTWDELGHFALLRPCVARAAAIIGEPDHAQFVLFSDLT